MVLGSSDNGVSLRPGALEAGGLALVTPSTITGQEQEKQALALIFSEVLALQRPKVKLATLAETLGAVNRDGLSDGYKRMYDDYRDTGLLSPDALKLVGTATGMHYVAQLKLQKFSQYSKSRSTSRTSRGADSSRIPRNGARWSACNSCMRSGPPTRRGAAMR